MKVEHPWVNLAQCQEDLRHLTSSEDKSSKIFTYDELISNLGDEILQKVVQYKAAIVNELAEEPSENGQELIYISDED